MALRRMAGIEFTFSGSRAFKGLHVRSSASVQTLFYAASSATYCLCDCRRSWIQCWRVTVGAYSCAYSSLPHFVGRSSEKAGKPSAASQTTPKQTSPCPRRWLSHSTLWVPQSAASAGDVVLPRLTLVFGAQEKQPPGVPDRVVRITGEAGQLMRAVALLLRKLASNVNYGRFTNNSVSYNYAYAGPGPNGGIGGMAYGGGPPGPNSMVGKPGSLPRRSEVTVSVPEARVGAIIGKGGEVISQLKSVVGVKIRISDREDFVPGTRNRKVTISGAADAVQIAQLLIQQKINQAAPGGPMQ